MSYAPPSQNPADLSTLAGAFRSIWRKLVQGDLDGKLPVSVIAVTADRNYVNVQPMISVLGTDDKLTARAPINRIPVYTPGAGNFVMSFPVAAGDFGWIAANDRDISLYLQTGQASGPNTNRQHSFSDAVFYPDKARQWALGGGDTANAVWQSLDGTTKITLGSSEIHIVHPTLVAVNAPSVTMSGNLTVDGTAAVDGDLTGMVNITATGQVEGATLKADNGASGTFSAGGHTLTIVNGIVTGLT